jgi:hypothetical protein
MKATHMSDEKEVTSGLGELRDRVGRLEQGLAENTATTKRIESDTSEMLELFRSAKGGFKVLGHIGSVLKWAVGFAAAITTIWFTIKGGRG